MVMITNANITIFNKHIENDIDVWYSTKIQNVHVYEDNGIDLNIDGLKGANTFKIRIPKNSFPKTFKANEEYQGLKDVSDIFTIQNEDWIYLGLTDMKIKKPSDIPYPKCMITGFSINLFGGLPHIRIQGE